MQHKKYILVAEDSPTQAEQLEQILRSGGYLVSCMKSGDEAFRKAKEKAPDIIVSDVLMPGLNGYEFCREIRSDTTLKNTPFILLTSLNDMADIVKGLECGADNYITKPVDRSHLLSMIQNLLTVAGQPGGEPGTGRVNFMLSGAEYSIPSDRVRILNMLLSTYEESVINNRSLNEINASLKQLRDNLELKVNEATKDLAREVEEKTKIEEEVRSSEQKSRNLIENPLFGVFSVTSEGKFIIINKAFSSMLGYDHPDMLRKMKFVEVFSKPAQHRELIKALKDEYAFRNLEVILRDHAGNEVYAILNAQVKNGIISGMVLDITRQKRIQKKEHAFQKELEIAKVKAEDSDRLKSIFLTNLSHEVRTPMNAIIGFSGLLGDPEITDETRKDFVQQISDSCYELHGLIENILEISKLDAGQIHAEERVFELNQLMQDIFQIHTREKKLRGKDEIQFRLHIPGPGEKLYIRSDPYSIYKIFAKLIDNAFKFTQQGSVDLGYEIPDTKYLRFFIKDTGIGMTEDQIRVVFGSFITANHFDTKMYSGAGLGLSICIKTVNLLEGDIRVESEPGKGAAFYFKIPLHTVKAGESEKPEEEAVDAAFAWAGKHILIVEDDFCSYKLIEAILSPTKARITWAKDGMEAMEKCKADHTYDLILMDFQLPNMNGIHTMSAIRHAGYTIPIIAITAFSAKASQETTSKAGFDDVLSKPVNPDILLQTIAKYISDA